jgi:hypothetical protein
VVRQGVDAVALGGVVRSADMFLIQGVLVGLVLALVIIFEPRGMAALYRNLSERRRATSPRTSGPSPSAPGEAP